MDQAELEECMKDLDINKDNKISFDEFKAWWLSGKQGLSKFMRQMLGIKLKAVKALNTVSGNLKEVVEEAAKEANPADMSCNSFKVNVNKFDTSGIMISTVAHLLSPAANEEF